MKTYKKALLALATTTFITVAPAAQAISFEITAAAFTPGTGYGVDLAGENQNDNPTLLNVTFSTSIFASQSFTLDNENDSKTFNFGTVNFQESDTGGGIRGVSDNETDNLDVTALLTFTNPMTGAQTLTATGTATIGSVSDAASDFMINWNSVLVDFGTGGQFQIDLADLSFSNRELKTQAATIMLLTLPVEAREQPLQQVDAVPEPASLALLGIGMMGLAAMRRRTL